MEVICISNDSIWALWVVAFALAALVAILIYQEIKSFAFDLLFRRMKTESVEDQKQTNQNIASTLKVVELELKKLEKKLDNIQAQVDRIAPPKSTDHA